MYFKILRSLIFSRPTFFSLNEVSWIHIIFFFLNYSLPFNLRKLVLLKLVHNIIITLLLVIVTLSDNAVLSSDKVGSRPHREMRTWSLALPKLVGQSKSCIYLLGLVKYLRSLFRLPVYAVATVHHTLWPSYTVHSVHAVTVTH